MNQPIHIRRCNARGLHDRIPRSVLLLIWAIISASWQNLSAQVRLWVDEQAVLERIAQVVPSIPPVLVDRPLKILLFCRNVGYGGHGSIPYLNTLVREAGRKWKIWEVVATDDPIWFEEARLKRFDAVFFNNTVGNLFTDAGLRSNLIRYVLDGGGILGVHGSSVAFTHWPGAVEVGLNSDFS